MRYTLAEALRIGQEKHPSISALRSSLNAATLKNQALNDIHPLGDFFLQDLSIRREQSDKAVVAATAEVNQAIHEVNYAVVRNYYTVIYTREQIKVAKELVDQLEIYLEQVKKIVHGKGGGVKGITQDTEDRLVNILAFAKAKLIEAETGGDRARAALREAMGLEPGTRVDVADELLPEIKAEISRESVVNLALSRRGEITLAQVAADVTRLEVAAQWSRRFIMQNPTFANGGDIHARSVPAAQREPDYKPGAIGPEMPDMLIGHRETRTAAAQQYSDRASEAARQARSLVGLEAENAHAKWIEASRKTVAAKEASKVGRDMVERAREASGGNLTQERILETEATAAQSFASYNEALFQQIIALANLERITAGGIRVNFPGR
jgi:outer membrane protein TolC